MFTAHSTHVRAGATLAVVLGIVLGGGLVPASAAAPDADDGAAVEVVCAAPVADLGMQLRSGPVDFGRPRMRHLPLPQ